MTTRNIVHNSQSVPALAALQLNQQQLGAKNLIGLLENIDSAAIIITNKCAAACAHCYNNSGPKKSDLLNCDQVVVFLDWWATHIKKFRRVGISGGEPFLHPNLNEFLLNCKVREIESSLTTGVYAVSANQLRTAAEFGLTKIRVSWDVFHERFVPKHDFLEFVNECKNNFELVEVNATYINDNNRDELRIWLDQVLPKGVNLFLSPIFNRGRAKSVSTVLPDVYRFRPSFDCFADFSSIAINFDGEFYPCCSIGGFTTKLSLGNLRNLSMVEHPIDLYNSNAIIKNLFVEKEIQKSCESSYRCVACYRER